LRWLREARRVLKPDGTLWVTGTHHIVSSVGFAFQRLGYRIINVKFREKGSKLLKPYEVALHWRCPSRCSCSGQWRIRSAGAP